MQTRTLPMLIAMLTCLVACATAFAQASWTVTLPLAGNYRPGRFMPVVLAPGPDAAEHKFYGAGILGVRVKADNLSTCVVAIPVLSRPDLQSDGRAITSNSPADAWREVVSEQFFVGTVDSASPPSGMSVGREPLVSQLNRSMLIGSEACAWNALDWLVMSPEVAGGLGDDWLSDLVATGTGVCISSASRPAGKLPWKAIEGGWELGAPLVGAHLYPWVPDAYLPAQAWQPRQAPEFRRQIVAVAVGIAGIVLACAMLKGRRRIVATLVAAAGAAAGVAIWSFTAPPAAVVQASIFVTGDVVRADHWLLVSSLSGGRVRIPWRNGLMPVFASRQQAASVMPQLVYEAGKPVAYECVLPRGQTLVMRWQALLPGGLGSDVRPVTASPMRAVAEACYLAPGWSLQGQLLSGEQWPTLVVAKRP